MSLKHQVNEMIAGKLPAKGNRHKNGIVTLGLRQRPQVEQIVDYLHFGQEKAQFPDREAKLIRNHPFMTQLDFFDMQEDQETQWEEQKKQHQAMELARELGMSAAQFQATRASQPLALPDGNPNTGGGGGALAFRSTRWVMALVQHHQVDMAQASHLFRGAAEEFRMKQSGIIQIHTRVHGEEIHKRLGRYLQMLPGNFGHKMLK